MTKVKCKCCAGTGSIELTGVYADTLALLRKAGETSGASLAKVAGCKSTAMNNRLAALEGHGLATSRPYGRLRLFRATDV